jgi:hypothetical protein
MRKEARAFCSRCSAFCRAAFSRDFFRQNAGRSGQDEIDATLNSWSVVLHLPVLEMLQKMKSDGGGS